MEVLLLTHSLRTESCKLLPHPQLRFMDMRAVAEVLYQIVKAADGDRLYCTVAEVLEQVDHCYYTPGDQSNDFIEAFGQTTTSDRRQMVFICLEAFILHDLVEWWPNMIGRSDQYELTSGSAVWISEELYDLMKARDVG